MSRSHKDRVNYFKHHEASPMMQKSKYAIDPEDIQIDVQDDIVYIMGAAGLRHGNNRKYEAKLKREQSKKDRLQRQEEAKKQIDEDC